MSESYKNRPLKRFFQEEQKKLLASFTAFSVATMLLVVQGNIPVKSILDVLALLLIAASIPAGILSYLISVKILESDSAPEAVQEKAENFFSLTLAMSAGGFMVLLFSASAILALAVFASFCACALYFNHIIDLWPDRSIDEKRLKADPSVPEEAISTVSKKD